MRESRRHKRRHRLRKRYAVHWKRMALEQGIAYGIVLLLWSLPLPNPVKLLTVTFHEFSHAVAALATGGRVFGIAIDPAGAGVTMGIGGIYSVILVAGYLGSSVIGAALYYVSVRWKANLALFVLVLFVLVSMLFGWLNTYTAIFGAGAVLIMLCLFPLGDSVKLFFLRMVGSACCLYAPLEIAGELIGRGGAPRVKGVQTPSDVVQLADLSGAPAALIAIILLMVQAGLLAWLIRWSCSASAKRGLREDIEESKMRRLFRRDLRAHDGTPYVLRPKK